MSDLRKLAGLLFVAACAPSTPPAPPRPRDAASVSAPVAKVWNATIDEFAASNIPIKNMDRASGFIATDPLGVTRDAAETFADCGTALGMSIHADRATYNIVVRGDSSVSTVKATVRFTQGGVAGDPRLIECTSTGQWESAFERKVKARAEAKPPM